MTTTYDDLIPQQYPTVTYSDLVPSSQASGPGTDKPMTAMSAIRGGLNGLTSGASKYVGAGMLYGLGALDPSGKANWNAAIDTMDQQRAEDKAAHPEAYGIGQLGGSAALGYATGGTSLLKNAAVGGVTGAMSSASENGISPESVVGGGLAGVGLGLLGGGIAKSVKGMMPTTPSGGPVTVAGMVNDRKAQIAAAAAGGNPDGSIGGILTQLGLTGLKAVAGGAAGAGLDYTANHTFGDGQKTFAESATSLPAEIGAMAGGYKGSAGLKGAATVAAKSAAKNISETGVSGQVANTVVQPMIQSVAPNAGGPKSSLARLLGELRPPEGNYDAMGNYTGQ